MTRRLLTVLMGIAITAQLTPLAARSQEACYLEGWARADKVVPPTQSPGSAVITSDPSLAECLPTQTLHLTVWYDSLSSPPTGLHVRRGSIGENGEQVLTLFDDYFPSGSAVAISVDEDLCIEFFSSVPYGGTLYFVVETAEYPDGAIRGQLFERCYSPSEHLSWGSLKSFYR